MVPKIDKREYGDHLAILEESQIRLNGAERKGMRSHFIPDWSAKANSGDGLDLGLVMNRLFARLMSVLGERINNIPEKHFAAFLDLVGVERLPGSPARAPITFYPARSSPDGQTVPKGTQVATTQTETEPAVTFETEDSFDLTSVSLERMVSLDSERDSWRDLTPLITAEDPEMPAAILQHAPDDQLVEHAMYIAHDDYFSLSYPQTLLVKFSLASQGDLPGEVEWQVYDGENWLSLPSENIVNGSDWLTAAVNSTAELHNFIAMEALEIDGEQRKWLRCRLMTPLIEDGFELPTIETIQLESVAAPGSAGEIIPQPVFHNTFAIDLNSDFYPFGERPRQRDVFYISSPLFFNPEASKTRQITLQLALASVPDVPLTYAAGDAVLRWEYFSGPRGWDDLTVPDGATPDDATAPNSANLRHGNNNLIRLSFTIGNDIAETKVNGESGYWIRARIASGNYSIPDTVSVSVDASGTATDYTYRFDQIVFRPPIISVADFRITYTDTGGTDAFPEGCKSINHIETRDHKESLKIGGSSFSPFLSLKLLESENDKYFGLSNPGLYFGFDRSLSNIRASQLVVMQAMGESDVAALRGEVIDSPVIVWEYRNSDGHWASLDTRDNTRALSSSGILSYTAPGDMNSSTEFVFAGDNPELYWIRARLAAGLLRATRHIQAFYLNSVWARSMRTVKNEILRAGSGERGQRLRISQAPILPGEILRVREDFPPAADELLILEKRESGLAETLEIKHQAVVRSVPESGSGSEEPVTVANPSTEIPPLPLEEGYWVRWYPVPNSRFSIAHDRHYVIDRVTGEITFSGKPVTRGRNRIWLESYCVNQGGDARRSAKIDRINQVTSARPYVAAVANKLAAEGGAAAENELQAVLNRGPQVLKHRHRAVTIEDFEALAREAEPGLSLVRVLPVTNANGERDLGAVTLIIVPFSHDRQPQPSPGLVDHIQRYLNKRGSETSAHRFYIIGPSYLDISVNAQILPLDPAAANLIVSRVSESLYAYFHPLTGGPENRGWPFAADLHISDVYRHLENIGGVDAVVQAAFVDENNLEVDTIEVGKNQLLSSGRHRVSIALGGT